MNCPACSAHIGAGQERCPACGAIVSPPTEGALAPNPASLTPPSRRKGEGHREIPGLRKKEPTWKDEVRERVQHRRRQRSGEEDELPLFREVEGAPVERTDAPRSEELEADGDVDPYAVTERVPGSGDAGDFAEEDVAGELALRPASESVDRDAGADDGRAARTPDPLPRSLPAEPLHDLGEDAAADDWPLELKPPVRESRAVERPARPAERIQASLVDLGVLLGLAVIVVYFTSRAAHVPVPGLAPSWLYLGGYLAFLSLAYAVYFTGTTGQTVGKMAAGLRVVDVAGRPPGHLRALFRTVVAVLGIVVVGGGLLPIFFDPARRALHDRLLKTRVIKG